MTNQRCVNSALPDALELIGEGASFRKEICGMLADVPLFDNLSPAELETAAAHMHAYRAPAGTTIFKEGERGTYLCMVVDGKIGVYKQSGAGEEKQIAVITKGKSFGEMSMVDDLPSSAAVRTLEETRIVLIGRENFRVLVEKHPLLGVRLLWKIARLMSLRLRQTSGQLVDYLE